MTPSFTRSPRFPRSSRFVCLARQRLVRLLLAICLATLSCQPAATKPRRIRVVSLSPSTTETVFALGAGELLHGRSRHCDHPSGAHRLPIVGGFADPNVEAVLALKPSLVIGSRGPAGPQLARQFHAHGIDTFFPPTNSLATIQAMIQSLGSKLDAQAAAKQLTDALRLRIEKVKTWAKTKKPITVLMVFDNHPIVVAGPGGFPDELLRTAGGSNVIDQGGAYPTVDLERLLVLNPDVIIDAMNIGSDSANRSPLYKTPGWSELPAVAQKRIRRLSSAAALRPGPRIADGLADIAKAIHGEEPPR